MDAATRSTRPAGPPLLARWQAGVVGGLLGALAWGVYASLRTPALLDRTVPAVLGLGPDAGLVGWVCFESLGAVLGVAFAALVATPSLAERLDDHVAYGLAGLAFGVLAWVVVTAVLLPALASSVGGAEVQVPLVALEHLVGQACYGVVLGLAYASLAE